MRTVQMVCKGSNPWTEHHSALPADMQARGLRVATAAEVLPLMKANAS